MEDWKNNWPSDEQDIQENTCAIENINRFINQINPATANYQTYKFLMQINKQIMEFADKTNMRF